MKRAFIGILFSLVLSVVSFAQGIPDAPTPKVATDSQVVDSQVFDAQHPWRYKDPYWQDHRVDTKKYWSMFALMGGSAYAHYKGGAICRQTGVEGFTSMTNWSGPPNWIAMPGCKCISWKRNSRKHC
jgi:hypothetical protein